MFSKPAITLSGPSCLKYEASCLLIWGNLSHSMGELSRSGVLLGRVVFGRVVCGPSCPKYQKYNIIFTFLVYLL